MESPASRLHIDINVGVARPGARVRSALRSTLLMTYDPIIHARTIRSYCGGSIHSPFPAVVGRLAFHAAFDVRRASSSTEVLDCFLERLECAEWDPGTSEFEAPARDEPTEVARLVAWLTVVLQNSAGARITRFGAGAWSTDGPCALAGFELANVAVSIMEVAITIVAEALVTDASRLRDFRLSAACEGRLRALTRSGQTMHLDNQARAVIEAAARRGIPAYRGSAVGRMYQLGQGSRRKHFHEAIGESTALTGSMLARDKTLTNGLLARVGIPVPQQVAVADLDAARKVAKLIGYPVVVKPARGQKGKGVTPNVRNEEELVSAFQSAEAAGAGAVLVEEMVYGGDHRILVVGGRYVAAARRAAAHVIGNGRDTVEKLVAERNASPLAKLPGVEGVRLDDEAHALLRSMGSTVESVLPPGVIARLRHTPNLSTGGTAEDVTDRVHPDIRSLSERAAAALGLDMAGIDFMSPDVTRSPDEVGGAICEVNAVPGIEAHFTSEVRRRAVLDSLLDRYFAASKGRISSVAIISDGAAPSLARLLASAFEKAGRCTAIVTPDAVQMRGISRPHPSGLDGSQRLTSVVFDPRVDAAIFHLPLRHVIEYGSPLDSYDVVVVPNLRDIEIRGMVPVAELARSVALLARQAANAVVVHAEDCTHVARVSGVVARICPVTRVVEQHGLREHVEHGGRAVLLRCAGLPWSIALEENTGTRVIVVNAAASNASTFPSQLLDAASYAAAAAWCAGVDVRVIAGVIEREFAARRCEPTPAAGNALSGPAAIQES